MTHWSDVKAIIFETPLCSYAGDYNAQTIACAPSYRSAYALSRLSLIEQAAGCEITGGHLEKERIDLLLGAFARDDLMRDLRDCGSPDNELWPTLEMLRH